MPFLLPALASALSDAFILYLCHQSPLKGNYNEAGGSFITRVGYLVPLAVVRLFLVSLPLPYHSLTGTAIRFTLLYHWFYASSLVLIIGHMLSIIMLDPSSLTSLVPTPSASTPSSTNHDLHDRLLADDNDGLAAATDGLDEDHFMRLVWSLLSLSLFSVLLHLILLWHVKSSAPSRRMDFWKREKHVLYYYAQQHHAASTAQLQQLERLSSSRAGRDDDDDEEAALSYDEEESLLLVPNLDQSGNSSQTPRQRRSLTWMYDQQRGMMGGSAGTGRSGTGSGTMLLARTMRCAMPEGYDEFMADLQNRVQRMRMKWTKQLEDFYSRAASAGGGGGGGAGTGIGSRLTAFTVLLELFADYNSSPNSSDQASQHHVIIDRLNLVWDADQGAELSFYVPQLLSFLLHGAFDRQVKLEEWILSKCQSNIYFAHKCYFFLRAWCLEASHHDHPTESNRLSRSSSMGSWSALTQSASGMIGTVDVEMGNGNLLGTDSLQQQYHLQRQQSLSLRIGEDQQPQQSSKSKRSTCRYPPEERSAMEALLHRVMECGEISARVLQLGRFHFQSNTNASVSGLNGGDGTSSASIVSEYAQTGLKKTSEMVPIDEKTSIPSQAHLESVRATAEEGKIGLLPSHYCRTAESVFLQSPQFFDSLMKLADELFATVPREERTSALRKALTKKEIEFLPSNAIYMPCHANPHHYTWRIVPQESIAISTKERVPLIICMEVVDFLRPLSATRKRSSLMDLIQRRDQNQHQHPGQLSPRHHENVHRLPSQQVHRSSSFEEHSQNFQGDLHQYSTAMDPLQNILPGGNSSSTERELVEVWRRSRRNPRRHSTLLDKVTSFTQDVTSFTQDSLRKFREQSNHGTGVASGGDSNGSIWVPGGVEMSGGNNSLAVWGDFPSLVRSFSGPTSEPTNLQQQVPASPIPTVNNDTSLSSAAHSTPTTPTITSGTMGQWSSPVVTSRTRQVMLSSNNDSSGGDRNVMETLMKIRNSMQTHNQVEEDNDTDYESAHENHPDESDYESCQEDAGYSSAYGSTHDYHRQELQGNLTGDERETQLPRRVKSRSSRPPPVVFKESWDAKQDRIRSQSAYGSHPSWRLLPILIKSNDDLRQEQLASQLIYRMASILAKERVPVWLCPYEIVALTNRGGIIECIPDTISIDSLKRNDPNFTSLPKFFADHFEIGSLEYDDAKACFVESLAAYSIVTFLIQIKDRHNGNILLDNRGHLIHIDFGFFFLSSPGKNSGFESAPFKLTRDFVDLMDGPDSKTFRTFRELCCRTFLTLRKHCYEIIMLVEMLMVGNEELACFRGRPEDAIRELRERFRLDLNDRACVEYVNALIDESLENWRTRWYDRYQRFCVGVL